MILKNEIKKTLLIIVEKECECQEWEVKNNRKNDISRAEIKNLKRYAKSLKR